MPAATSSPGADRCSFTTRSLIRERAYAIWEQEGRPQGREWDHWVRAAGEVITTPLGIPTRQTAPAEAKGAARKAPERPQPRPSQRRAQDA